MVCATILSFFTATCVMGCLKDKGQWGFVLSNFVLMDTKINKNSVEMGVPWNTTILTAFPLVTSWKL